MKTLYLSNSHQMNFKQEKLVVAILLVSKEALPKESGEE